MDNTTPLRNLAVFMFDNRERTLVLADTETNDEQEVTGMEAGDVLAMMEHWADLNGNPARIVLEAWEDIDLSPNRNKVALSELV